MNRETLRRWQSDRDLKALRDYGLEYGLEYDEPSRFMKWAHKAAKWLFALGFVFWCGVHVGRTF